MLCFCAMSKSTKSAQRAFAEGADRCESHLGLAKKLQCAQPTVTNIINGKRSPSAKLAIRLERLLGIPVEESIPEMAEEWSYLRGSTKPR